MKTFFGFKADQDLTEEQE
jgi:DNA polymerase zeta